MVSHLYTGTHGRLHGQAQAQKLMSDHGEEVVREEEIELSQLLQQPLQNRQEQVLDTELLLLLSSSH
ncbi:MAG: hypothetical protein CM15mV22_2010 [Eurybiavirus sp.]|nr:MAG: hypothetical protein CM15mV22_2010 [Eurybiavirus sp.]